MANITLSNIDWEIIDDVKESLERLTVTGTAVFQSVAVTTSQDQAKETKWTQSPIAIIRYVQTNETWLPDTILGCACVLEITVAAKADTEAARLKEALRLKNAVLNAIEGALPANATGWGQAEGAYHRKLEWGQPTLDINEREPWGVATIPLEVGFTVSGHTGR